MTLTSVRYSALSQNEDEEMCSIEDDPLKFGTDPGYFRSAFTYANYNDLDNMGYQAPKRFGSSVGRRFGRFTFTKDYDDQEELIEKETTWVEHLIIGFSLLLILFTMPFSLIFTLKFIGNSEQMVVLRLGKAKKPRGSGPALVIPCVDVYQKIDTRVTAFNVPPLQIITFDRGLVEVGATVYLRVRDVIQAVCGIQERNNSTRTLSSTLLYRYLSRKRVCELQNFHERRTIGDLIREELCTFTHQFGVEITKVELSDAKIIKDGENMGMAALSSVVKSEVGQQIWSVIGPTLEEIAQEQQNTPETTNEPSTSNSVQENCELINVDHLIMIINMVIDEQLTKAVGKIFQILCRDLPPMIIDLKNGRGSASKGEHSSPDVVFEMEAQVFNSLLKKDVSPVNAYMAGTLKIQGSMQDALSLKYLAERVAHLI